MERATRLLGGDRWGCLLALPLALVPWGVFGSSHLASAGRPLVDDATVCRTILNAQEVLDRARTCVRQPGSHQGNLPRGAVSYKKDPNPREGGTMQTSKLTRSVATAALAGCAVAAVVATAALAVVGSTTVAVPYSLDTPVLVSGPSPLAGCPFGAADAKSVNYPNTAVEPFVAVNPTNPDNIVGDYQQDRWNDGGAHGLTTAFSTTAARHGHQVGPFSKCSVRRSITRGRPIPGSASTPPGAHIRSPSASIRRTWGCRRCWRRRAPMVARPGPPRRRSSATRTRVTSTTRSRSRATGAGAEPARPTPPGSAAPSRARTSARAEPHHSFAYGGQPMFSRPLTVVRPGRRRSR